MVSKITLFEAHLDGARFGPVPRRSGGDETAESAGASDDDGGRSRIRVGLFGIALIVALLGAIVAVKRIRSAKRARKEKSEREQRRAGIEDRLADDGDSSVGERTAGAIE